MLIGSVWRALFRRVQRSLLLLLSLQIACTPAETLTLAVASNFANPMREIASAFEQETEHSVRLAFGSSGKLTAQILQGAPFQAFFSADQTKPQLLIERGVATPGSQFTYALGGLALWSTTPASDPRMILQSGNFDKLALANPRLAPYGAAAIEILERLNLKAATQDKWVQGENIAQTYQFVDSGNAAIGFVATSQIVENGELATGSAWIIPSSLHSPIRQDAVLLGAQPGSAARQFMRFMQSSTAQNIINSYGYQSGAMRAEATP